MAWLAIPFPSIRFMWCRPPKTESEITSQIHLYIYHLYDLSWKIKSASSVHRLFQFWLHGESRCKMKTLLNLHWCLICTYAIPRIGGRTEMRMDPEWTTESGAARGLSQKYWKALWNCVQVQLNGYMEIILAQIKSFFHLYLYFYSFMWLFII